MELFVIFFFFFFFWGVGGGGGGVGGGGERVVNFACYLFISRLLYCICQSFPLVLGA